MDVPETRDAGGERAGKRAQRMEEETVYEDAGIEAGEIHQDIAVVDEYGDDGGGNNKEDQVDMAVELMLPTSKVDDMAEDTGNGDENV